MTDLERRFITARRAAIAADYPNLNPCQREAVLSTEGPLLLLAGAGSGKTTVLIHRVANLLRYGRGSDTEELPTPVTEDEVSFLEQYAASPDESQRPLVEYLCAVEPARPWEVLAITFTNKAANELKERLGRMLGEEAAGDVWASTFHSACVRILRRDIDRIGFDRSFTIYDSDDSKRVIRDIIRELSLEEKSFPPREVQTVISRAKNDMQTPEEFLEQWTNINDWRKIRMGKVYTLYNKKLREANALDFDDLLWHTVYLLQTVPEVRDYYRRKFRYVLIDEYQDTNALQYELAKLLTGSARNICVVGDDAQSIYSFRGANIHNILGLSKEYPGLKIFKLERNYRSTQNIVNTANSLIAKNKEQIPKQVFSEKEQGNKVQVISAYSDFEEGFIVSNRIAEMRLTTHCDYNDFAVLYRTNAQSRVLEEALRKRNIPYRIYGGMSFYQRKEIKDAIAYFRLTINPDDEEALKRVINYPARGIGNTTLSKLIERAHSQESSIWKVISDPIGHNLAVNNGTLNKLKIFKDLIDELRYEADKKNTSELAETIIKRSGIWGEISSDRTPENISRQENIEELLNGIREFCALREEAGEEQTSLSDFLAEISLATDQDNGDETEQDKVTLMTVHASKGLEFKQVFIVGVEEDLFPSAMSKNSEREIEEERRLLYVAITRAEENCTLTYALSRYRNGQTVSSPPSRFIKDLDSRYVDMPVQTKQESPRETISWNRFRYGKTAQNFPMERRRYGSHTCTETIRCSVSGQTVD